MRIDRFLIVGCAFAALIGCGGGGGGGGNNGPRVFMVTDAERLISFDPATPGSLESNDLITGLAGGESIVGMDFRPADGELYALGSTGQLYIIDLDLAAAVAVGPGIGISLAGVTNLGFDFNPVADRIRVILDDDQNFRINPNTGAIVDSDPVTPGVQLDTAINPTADITAAAYTPVVAGLTTLYAVDEDDSDLYLVGGIGGAPSPNGGVKTLVGTLGVLTFLACAMDITSGGTAYFATATGSTTTFYTVNLTTGAATLVGTVGGSHKMEAMSFRD